MDVVSPGRAAAHELVWLIRRQAWLLEHDPRQRDLEAWIELYAREAHLMVTLDNVDRAEAAWAREREVRERLTGPLVLGA